MHFPSLSEDGWVTATDQQADYLFAHFFASDANQTQLYVGQISSMAGCIQNATGDVQGTIQKLTTELSVYFGRYFSNVQVEVTEDKRTGADNTSVALIIFATFLDAAGKEINLSNLLDIQNNKVAKIVKLSNG